MRKRFGKQMEESKRKSRKLTIEKLKRVECRLSRTLIGNRQSQVMPPKLQAKRTARMTPRSRHEATCRYRETTARNDPDHRRHRISRVTSRAPTG